MHGSIWDWLEIEPTTDKTEIKKAYARMAKKYHPTEHPEEFQTLRESYRTAMEIADRKALVFKADPDEDDEDEEESEYDFDGCLEDDEEEEYDFDGCLEDDDEDEEESEYDYDLCPVVNNDSGYDFDGILGNDSEFSKRQSFMLSFFEEMLEIFKLHPQEYGAKEYLEAAFKLWTKHPYTDELTPEFIAALFDKLDYGCLFHPVFYRVLERILFEGKSGDEYQRLKARFYTYRADSELYKWGWQDTPQKGAILNMFFGRFDCSTPVFVGYLLEEGVSKKHPLRKYYFDKGILFSVGGRFKYYYICDCTCRINRKNGDLTLRDVDGKKIFKMVSTHKAYYYVLEKLAGSGCTFIDADSDELRTFTTEFNLEKTPLHRLVFDRRFNRISNEYFRKTAICILMIIAMTGLTVIGFYATTKNRFSEELFLLCGGLEYVITLVTFALLGYLFFLLIMDMFYIIRFIAMVSIYHTLQKECESESGVYDFGNRLFVFKDYIFYPKETHLIPIKSITSIEFLFKKELYEGGYLKISANYGKGKEYLIGSPVTANALIKEIKSRMNEYKQEKAG